MLSSHVFLTFPLALLYTASFTFGLYFHVGETEKKCFNEDLPDETLVVGVYKVEMYDRIQNRYVLTLSGFGMRVEVTDEQKAVILSRIYSAEGRFSFKSSAPGEHRICLLSNSTAWFGGSQLRIHLDIRVGEETNDYAEIAQKDKLSELEIRVRRLLEQTQQISHEQDYQRTREERFRETSESTNHLVLGWALVQTIVLLTTGVFQMTHLKRFFEAKKLV